MTEQEKINFETQKKLAMQDAKFAMFMHELQQQREDIRRAQEKHDADIKEIRADIKEIRDEIRGTLKHIQNLTLASMVLTIAAVVGILAVAVGVLGFLWTTTTKSVEPPAQTQSVYQMPPNYQATSEQPAQ